MKITLEATHPAKLRRLPERAGLSEETLARSQLATALDAADRAPQTANELLDGIPDPFERARLGLAQVRAGLGTRLDDP